ncbi:MAG: hypothetical protein WD315_03945 [Balneolaceae bacterium]
MTKNLSSHIPQSLNSYLELFQQEPEKAISRLKAHLDKRGPDAVGHYLLSWFHHLQGDSKKAVQAAWAAKIFAPGSPAMEKLHYFMAHPDSFRAWSPTEVAGIRQAKPAQMATHPISDLDALIEKLSTVESKRIDFNPDKADERNLAEQASRVDDIATETLAQIHEKQGHLELAISTYQKLIDTRPDKAESFRKRILELKEKLKEKQDSGE